MLEPFVFGVKNVTHQKFLFPSMRPKETFEYLCGFVWMHAKEFFSWKMNIFNKNRMYFLKFSWLNIGFFLESTFGSLDITSLLLLWMHATFSFFPFLLEMSLTKFWLETTYFHSKCFFFWKVKAFSIHLKGAYVDLNIWCYDILILFNLKRKKIQSLNIFFFLIIKAAFV